MKFMYYVLFVVLYKRILTHSQIRGKISNVFVFKKCFKGIELVDKKYGKEDN